MGKKKKAPVDDVHPHEILRQNLKRSNKIITKDGKVKKKILKQFTAYQCSVCNKKFSDKYNRAAHEKLHLNEEFPCTKCSYVGKTKKYLGRHMSSKHGTPRYECGVCGRAFHHPSGLKEHAMVHTGEKPLKCKVCEKTFRVSYSLNTHMLIHKNEKPFKCSFCAYACRDNSTLRKHEHRHMGIIKTFPCKICHKTFDSKPKLKYHISEIHLDYLELDLKRHRCEECGKTFKLKANMVKHVQVVHNKSAPCPCPLCGRCVKHEVYLPRHLRTHFPQRPHVCVYPGCKKAFKDKSDLKKHSKIHTPHLHAACAQCGATFSRAHRLVAHMRTHEPREKSVTCDYCDVNFYTKNYLIKHIQQKHSEDKQRYICDYCGLVTFNKPSIVMHIKYGQCRNNDLRCKICKTTYKHFAYLRSHYLKTHKMRYKPMKHRDKKEKKPLIEIKVEPMGDPYEEVQLSLLEVNKDEIDAEEEGNMENDLISYSNHVLSEDLQKYLLNDDPSQNKPESSFDEFLLKHVFHKQLKDEEPEPKIEETDELQAAFVAQKIKEVIKKAKKDEAKKLLEKKRARKAKVLEKKLKREAKMMRRKRRRERFELERVRQIYNERMKKAAAESLKKEPAKKIKYFQQKMPEDATMDKGTDKTQDSNHKDKSIDCNDYPNNHKNLDSNEHNSENLTSTSTNDISDTPNDKNTEKDINVTKNLDISTNNNKSSGNTAVCENDEVGNAENEPMNNCNYINDKNIHANVTENGTYDKDNSSIDKQNYTNHDDSVTIDKEHGTKDKDNGNVTNYKDNGLNDEDNGTNDKDKGTIDKQNFTNHDDSVTIDKEHGTKDKDNGNVTNYKDNGLNDEDNGTNDKDKGTIDKQNYTNHDDSVTIDKEHGTKDNGNVTNYKDKVINNNSNKDKLNNTQSDVMQPCDKYNSTSEKDNSTNDKNCANVNEKETKLNDKDDDDTNDDSDDDKSDSDSNYKPHSENESTPNKKMNFQTYQCYICFKLYPTKEELISHCESHFDICNSTTLSKCPACGHVVNRNIAKHMRIKHDIHITIPHTNITRRDDGQGSKYCYKMADTVMEIIPSVKMLNHSAAVAIDKRNRERRDKIVAKTRLIKKGTEWIVENYAVNVSYREMPEFTEQELSKLPVSGNYIDRLGELGRLARTKGVKILFPCQVCDKICQNFSALKLHGRRHDPNKKPFTPRQSKRNPKPTLETPKVKNTENRLAKPQPIKNKHKCDKKLMKFYETHIRGADIEFWQFLKIYNRMDRENIQDFTDLESRTDFGMHQHGNNDPRADETSKTSDKTDNKTEAKKTSKTSQQCSKIKTKYPIKWQHKEIAKSIQKRVTKIGKTSSKLGQQSGLLGKKPLYKRTIMISKKQYLEREKKKKLLREKIHSKLLS